MDKSQDAFRTISEVSDEIGVPQHVLRYWETRFPQLKPIQRAGNRRYYRPSDIALVRRIHGLLAQDGYTVKGVQKLLASRDKPVADTATSPASTPPSPSGELAAIRRALARALEASAA